MSKLVSFDDYENKHDVNPVKKQQLYLTEAKIRSIPAHQNKSVEEILNVINTLHQFALLTYDLVNNEINQQVFNKKVA